MLGRLALALVIVVIGGVGAAPSGKSNQGETFDYPQWRGHNRDGISRETGLLKTWPKNGPTLLWQTTTMGKGFSTPSIAEGRIFLMGNRDGKELVIALDEKTGEELWATATTRDGRGGRTGGQRSGPRCTPTVRDGLVYAIGFSGAIVCCESATGKPVWYKSLTADFGGRVPQWGYSESPLVDGDKVVVTPGGSASTIVALNKKTGATIWKSQVPGGDPAHYSSMIIGEVNGIRQYIQFLSRGVVGIAADDGKFLWRYDEPACRQANCSTPIFHDSYVLAASAYNTGGGMAQLTPRGDGIAAKQVYFLKQLQNHHGGMVLVDGYVYGTGSNALYCIEFKTGKVMWESRRPGKGSISYADGRLYCRSERGPVTLVEATPEKYVELGRFDPPEQRGGNEIWPYPIIANGRLYLRDQEVFLCYDVKERSE